MNHFEQIEQTPENTRKDIEIYIQESILPYLSEYDSSRLKMSGVLTEKGEFFFDADKQTIINNESDFKAYVETELIKKLIVFIDSLPGGGKGYVTDSIKQWQGRENPEQVEVELDNFLYIAQYLGILDKPEIKRLLQPLFTRRAEYFTKDRETFLYNYIHYGRASKFLEKAWKSGNPVFYSPNEVVYNRKKGDIGSYGLMSVIPREKNQTLTVDGVGSVSSIVSPVSSDKSEKLVVFGKIEDILMGAYLRDYQNNKLNDGRLDMRIREQAVLGVEKFLLALKQANVIYYNEDYHKKVLPNRLINEIGFRDQINNLLPQMAPVESYVENYPNLNSFLTKVSSDVRTSLGNLSYL